MNFAIHGKLRKREIYRNQNKVIWNYNQRDTLIPKSEIFGLEFWENEEQ